jgi:hypothetical protein
MSTSSTILRASSIAVIAAAGYIIWQQPGLILPSAFAEVPATTETAVVTATPPTQPSLSDNAGIVVPPAQADLVNAELDTAEPVSPFGLPCGLSVHSEAMPGAMVALDIMAPCRPGLRVEIEHADLTISLLTDAMGLLTVDVPAFETPAIFTIRLGDGEEAVTIAGLPDLIDIGRVAISWQGDLGIELHAFEGGAAFGAQGHVWQEAPGSAATTAIGSGGFLSSLGDPTLEGARLAQVYSYPRALGEMPRLSVDIPVRAETCGEPVSANSHHLTDSGQIETLPITLVLPGCDAVGDYLVLQNLFDTLRLAAN